MQTIHCARIHHFLAAAVLGASLGCAAPVFAASAILNPDGKLTYIGPLGSSVFANAINDAGQVVGYYGTASQVIGYQYGTANDSGHAFMTGPNGAGMRDLGTLGTTNSHAYGINNAGQVAGSSYSDLYYGIPPKPWPVGPASSHAFITGPNGVGMRDLGTLGGSDSYARGINDAGQVVGESYVANGSSHAFITGPNGAGMRDLGTLGGGSSGATGINDAGQVVGNSYTATWRSSWHAFITGPNGVGMRDLGTLGGSYSFATGINDAGQVVGGSGTASGSQHAFITGPNGGGDD